MATRLLFVMFALPVSLWAQTPTDPIKASRYRQGSWLIGIQGGYSPDNIFSHYATLQPYGGYFVNRKLLLGLGGSGIRQYTDETFRVATLAAGPLIRYQFTQTRFSPFLIASYQFGQQSLSGTYTTWNPATHMSRPGTGDTYAVQSRLVKVGIAVALTRAVRVDAALCWQDIVTPADLSVRSYAILTQFQVGLHYQPGR